MNYSKAELYNKIVDLYKATGQGLIKLPQIESMDAFSELLEDGLVKVVTTPYTHLPDDVKICLTKGYCVEESGKDSRVLEYMRIYLNHEMIVEVGKFNLTLKAAIQDVKLMEGYSKWLTENHEEISEIHNLEYLEDTSDILSDETLEYLKTRGFFKENETVAKSINLMINNTELKKKEIELQTNLNDLYIQTGPSEKHKDDLIKGEKNIVEIQIELKKRHQINAWLLKKPQDKKVQECLT